MGHLLGGEKGNFLIRGSCHDGAVAAAPVESCRSVVPRSPRSHLGSVVDVRNRLHRVRCRFQHISANSLISAAHKTMNSLALASRALGGPQDRRMRCSRLPTNRPTPRGLQEPISPRKKCAIWTRWRPVPVKNVNFFRAPGIVIAVSLGLILPHR